MKMYLESLDALAKGIRSYDENKDNIIGMYIRHISEMEISDDLKAKALCYGMKAFYQTK